MAVDQVDDQESFQDETGMEEEAGEMELHNEESNDSGPSGGDSGTGYGAESQDDTEEDGFDVASHGGGEIEAVPEFDGAHALTEGFDAVDEGEAADLGSIKDAGAEEYEQPESVCGRDNRVKINNTRGIPWRMICKLIITTSRGSRLGGTGWFIGPRCQARQPK